VEITRKGDTTIATLKDENGKYINHAKAICSKDDRYDYEFGKNLAVSRLFGIVPTTTENEEHKNECF
ncbi:MAG: hypothetical protein NC299_16885, partial [Lachnospiraceae bacterium]|nr:hypothetical protein [Lachnospiraceae bacterium]